MIGYWRHDSNLVGADEEPKPPRDGGVKPGAVAADSTTAATAEEELNNVAFRLRLKDRFAAAMSGSRRSRSPGPPPDPEGPFEKVETGEGPGWAASSIASSASKVRRSPKP